MEAVGRSIALVLLLLAISPLLIAETVTLPAVASLPPGTAAAPFFSDVRVFNTSYTLPVSVTAVYRCFLGTCPAAAPQATFTLAPRKYAMVCTLPGHYESGMYGSLTVK